MRARLLRATCKGGVLPAAMVFMIIVMVAGTVLLSVSTIHRLDIVRNGVDVRLMIACEAGAETIRGRFTLVKNVQDDWTWVSNSSWTDLGTANINGMNVQLQAMRTGADSVPRCRVRARASASGRTRVVEQTIKIASFSDYAVFAGGSSSLGVDYKCVGNYYNNGNINVPYLGARIYGKTELTGAVSITSGETQNTIFPNYNPITVGAKPFPTDATEWDYLKDRAGATGYVFAENTMEIILNGTTFTRWYVRRKNTATAGAGTIPASAGSVDTTTSSWVNPTNGVVDYTNSAAANPRLVNADYEWVSQTLNIPDEGVIYIQSGAASGITVGPLSPAGGGDRDCDAVSPRTNGFTQAFASNSAGSDAAIFQNAESGYGYSSGYTRILLLSGTLSDRRVSIVCDHRIIVKQCIAYQGNLTTPDNRRFFNDGTNGKQSTTALNMKEMLGVMSKTEIHPTPTWWTPLAAANRVTGNVAGETIPGHNWGDIKDSSNGGGDYCMDGVYLALGRCAPTRNYGYASGTGPLGEMWYCGGLICQGSYGGGNGNTYYRRNYDWDYRMNFTMPPYFLRTYNTTAVFVPGTWRTWEE